MSRYEIVDAEIAALEQRLKDARFALHDDAWRDLLRSLKALVWKHESRLDGIRSEGGAEHE